MFNTLYEKMISASKRKSALVMFLLFTFLESFIFPIPPDIMMIPIIAANRTLLWHLGWLAGMVSIFGGVIGYFIGFYFFTFFGEKILNFYHMQDSFEVFTKTFDQYGFWIISLKGLTPIPFKLVAITSGITKFDFKTFFIASCLARFSRFYFITFIIWYTGDKFQYYLKKYFSLYLILSILAIFAGFGCLKLIGI